MKRLLALLLTLTLVLPLFACGGGSLVQDETETETLIRTTGEPETAGVTGEHNATGFSVGFGRGNITPTTSVPLAGYGATSFRMSQNVMDDLYVTCVAIQDENGERLLFFQLDIITIGDALGGQIRSLVSKATNTPEDHILLNATHTHSGPDQSNEDGGIGAWKSLTYKAATQAAKDAVADLDASRIYIGTAETQNLNFVRRYYKENGFTTPNADYGSGDIIAHESEIDGDIRFVKFDRENQRDIVIANWQCHATMTGGSAKTDISSDFVGQFRKYVDRDLDMELIYLQGGAGNVNPSTRLPGEPSPASTYTAKGQALCDALKVGLESAVETPAGKVRAARVEFEGNYTHEDEDKLSVAQEVKALFSNNQRSEASSLAIANGISSVYEASAIVARSTRPATGKFMIYCYAFGDVGIAAAPFEMFCNTYRDLRAQSPFGLTLTCGYSNSGGGYMPAADSFPNKGYEVVTCAYVRGTAEEITATQLEMLGQLYAQ